MCYTYYDVILTWYSYLIAICGKKYVLFSLIHSWKNMCLFYQRKIQSTDLKGVKLLYYCGVENWCSGEYFSFTHISPGFKTHFKSIETGYSTFLWAHHRDTLFLFQPTAEGDQDSKPVSKVLKRDLNPGLKWHNHLDVFILLIYYT